MLFCNVKAQKINVNDYANKAQAYAILSAQYSKDAYSYARQNYFKTSRSAIKSNADTGMVSIQIAVEFADSALAFANDSSVEAIAIMIAAKKYQTQTLKLFNSVRSEDDNLMLIDLCEKAMYEGGNAIAEAYRASLSFNMKSEEIIEKQEGNSLSEESDPSRDVSRLETDEFSYMTIKELYGKRLVEIDDELVLLKAEAKKSKGEKLKKINKAINQLKLEEDECFQKMKGSEDGLINVRNELSEEMLKVVHKDIFTTEKNGFYNDNVPVPVNNKIPERLVFRVQIGFFKSQLPPEHFEGIFPLSSQKVDNTYYRYVAGNFAKYNDAKEAKIAVVEKGYTDSFVVAYFNGKKIPISEALKKEKDI